VAARLETRLKQFASNKLLPDGEAVAASLARWSTRLSRLMVAGVTAFALFDRPPHNQERSAPPPPIEILRTKPVPLNGHGSPARPSAGH
jgi:hypothetical protein